MLLLINGYTIYHCHFLVIVLFLWLSSAHLEAFMLMTVETDRLGSASIWFKIWDVVDPGPTKFRFFQAIKKIRFFPGKFGKISIFPGKFLKNFDFFRLILKKIQFSPAIKKISIFHAKNCSFTATSGQIILFLFKSHHFRTYFLYIIRYNNFHRPPAPAPRPPPKNRGVATQTPQD